MVLLHDFLYIQKIFLGQELEYQEVSRIVKCLSHKQNHKVIRLEVDQKIYSKMLQFLQRIAASSELYDHLHFWPDSQS